MNFKLIFLAAILSFSFVSCDDEVQLPFATSPVDEDFSHIKNPKERWEAYDLKNYYIEQSWTCECFPPNRCGSFIYNNEIADVRYEIIEEVRYGRDDEKIFNYVMDKAITIEEAFALIEKYRSEADKIEIQYDEQYGFPSKIFIDIDYQTADEEIIRSFSNLKSLRKWE